MIFKFRCQTCNWPCTKKRSPSQVKASGEPKFCDMACAGVAHGLAIQGEANPMWNGGGTHGTPYKFRTLGCKCEVCSHAQYLWRKGQRLRRRQRDVLSQHAR